MKGFSFVLLNLLRGLLPVLACATCACVLACAVIHPRLDVGTTIAWQALRDGAASCEDLAHWGVPSLILRCLASADAPLRALSYEALALYSDALSAARFRWADAATLLHSFIMLAAHAAHPAAGFVVQAGSSVTLRVLMLDQCEAQHEMAAALWHCRKTCR